jgi:hypothetical protein
MPAESTHGSCLCGAVRFTATLPSRWVAHCHCSYCRRAHGAAFVTWVGLDEAAVAIDDGRGALRWNESSPGARRGFCGQCGSPMFFQGARWPGEMHVARALFAGPVDREPQVHAFWGTHVPWVTLGDELPRRPAPDAPQ